MRNTAILAMLSVTTFLMINAQDKPRVFITDSNSWEMRSQVGGSADAFAGTSSGGARPQTAEVIKTFGQRCPEVIVNDRVNASDYVVELDHEGGKGLLQHKDKIAVFVRTSGDSIFSKSTLSVGGSVQDACGAITQHWATHENELKAASTPVPVATAPPAAPVGSGQLENSAALSISSNPTAADIEIDGNFVGSTPSTIQLKSGLHEILITKKGYRDWQRKINVSGGSISVDADLDPATTQ
jgi:hypothetical protein